jgi:hypothetical protein
VSAADDIARRDHPGAHQLGTTMSLDAACSIGLIQNHRTTGTDPR